MHESEKWKWSCSVVSNSSRPQGLQPTRLLHPSDFPGKNTGVGCPCLLWRIAWRYLYSHLKCILLIIREMQTKSAMRYLTLVRTAIIKKSTNSKCWRGCGGMEMLLHSWWECKWIQPLWRIVWRFLKELGVKLLYHPAIPLLGIYSEKIIIEKDICTSMFIAELFTIGRTWKQPKCPSTDERIKKLLFIYTMEYLLLLFSYSVMSDSLRPWTAACQASLSFTVSWSLLQLRSHWVCDAMQTSHPLLSPSSPAQSFPTSGPFPMSNHKKKCIWHCSNEVDEPGVCYTEWSKSERERQRSYSNAYMWNLEWWYWWTYFQDSSGDTDMWRTDLWTQWGRRGWDKLRE